MSQHKADHHLFINGALIDADGGATYDAINPATEEIFGPVLEVIPFENDDDAVHIANDSIYGLSGSVISASPSRAMKVIG